MEMLPPWNHNRGNLHGGGEGVNAQLMMLYQSEANMIANAQNRQISKFTDARINWNSHQPSLPNYETNNYENIQIKREQSTSPQSSSMDYQMDSQFTNLLTPSPQGNDTRLFFGDALSIPGNNNNNLLRFNPLTPPGLPNAALPPPNSSYDSQQNHQQITPQRSNLPIIETPSITPPMDDIKSPKSRDGDDKNDNGDSTSGEEKLDSDVDCSAIYQPQYNSHGKMRTHKCKRCDFMAKTKAEYWMHIEVHMNPAKILKCLHYPRCRFVTELKHYLEYHIRLHKNEKPFRCEKCNYRCINKSMLNSHMKSHSGLYQYHCRDCDYATKYCHSLKKHLRKYEHEPGDVLDEDGNPDPTIIVDVNGRRRGPKGRKGRITKCPKLEMKSLNSPSVRQRDQQHIIKPETPSTRDNQIAAMLMGQNPNIMNNFMPNTLTNMMQRSENLQYSVVLPYLQMLASHQAALARLAPGKLQDNKINKVDPEDYIETDEGSNAMDLSQTPKKMDLEDAVEEEEEEITIESQNTRSNTNTPIISSTSSSKRKGRTLDLEQICTEELNASSSDDARQKRSSTPQQIIPVNDSGIGKPSGSETSSNSFNVESLISSPSSSSDKIPAHKQIEKNNSKYTNIPQITEYYPCKHCDIYFRDVVLHSLHMGFHSCDDVFKCNMCGEKCNSAVEFFVHLARKAHDEI